MNLACVKTNSIKHNAFMLLKLFHPLEAHTLLYYSIYVERCERNNFEAGRFGIQQGPQDILIVIL